MFPIPLLQIFRLFYNCFWKTANAILTIRYIRSTFITDQTNFIENSQNCKQIDDFLDLKNSQKRQRPPKPIFVGLESEKYENWILVFWKFWKYVKFAHEMSVHNGSYTFPNELMRFRIKATPSWKNIRTHFKNVVIN